MSIHAQQASFTLAERHGARRLLDCGSFVVKPGPLTSAMYLTFLKRGWAQGVKWGESHTLIRLTPFGRNRLHLIEKIAA